MTQHQSNPRVKAKLSSHQPWSMQCAMRHRRHLKSLRWKEAPAEKESDSVLAAIQELKLEINELKKQEAPARPPPLSHTYKIPPRVKERNQFQRTYPGQEGCLNCREKDEGSRCTHCFRYGGIGHMRYETMFIQKARKRDSAISGGQYPIILVLAAVKFYQMDTQRFVRDVKL